VRCPRHVRRLAQRLGVPAPHRVRSPQRPSKSSRRRDRYALQAGEWVRQSRRVCSAT
jgi:hypothetical protein